MISNIEISFLRLPLNPRISAVFVGLDNYIRILSDAAFWHSLWMTFWYTALVVMGSTGLGLAVAIFFNREFRLRKTARSLVILSYVAVYFAGVCLEIHVQQRLRHCELSGR
jgi:multiple sugar transport system permease protein